MHLFLRGRDWPREVVDPKRRYGGGGGGISIIRPIMKYVDVGATAAAASLLLQPPGCCDLARRLGWPKVGGWLEGS